MDITLKILARLKFTIQIIEDILPIEAQAFLFIYYVILLVMIYVFLLL